MPAIVQRIHAPSHTITITPPAGLLELGRQQHLLDRLKPELMAYGKPAAGSMAERLGQRYMPTKRQLVSAGREDLVKLITSAGGFIHVAHLLGLRAKRKPAGQYTQHERETLSCTLPVLNSWVLSANPLLCFVST